MQSFISTTTKVGNKFAIVLPFNPNQLWGDKERYHIHGTINGCAIRGELALEGDRYYLVLGEAWRRDNGVEAGTEVEVKLMPEGPQAAALSADLSAALEGEGEASAFLMRCRLSIEKTTSAGLKAPSDPQHARRALLKWSSCSKQANGNAERRMR